MSESFEEAPPWSRGRWVTVAGLIFCLHVGGLFFLAEWRPVAAAVPIKDLKVAWLPSSQSGDSILDNFTLSDPTMFSVIGAKGFSGPAWLTVEPPAFEIPEWREPGYWHTQNVAILGQALSVYVRRQAADSTVTAPKAFAPAVARIRTDVLTATKSRIHIEGALRDRFKMDGVSLKTWETDGLLNPTYIEVAVDSQGAVFSARIESAGPIPAPMQTAADQYALQIARALLFAPVQSKPGGEPLTRGRLMFQWGTVEKSVAP